MDRVEEGTSRACRRERERCGEGRGRRLAGRATMTSRAYRMERERCGEGRGRR